MTRTKNNSRYFMCFDYHMSPCAANAKFREKGLKRGRAVSSSGAGGPLASLALNSPDGLSSPVEAGAQIADFFCQAFGEVGGGGVVADDADEGGADDDAVGHRG